MTTSNHPTIMVVDDSPHDYETYVRFLGKAKPDTYRTQLCSYGRELLSLEMDAPHCLLLDLNLPDMSGLEVLQKLKAGNGGALPFPVIIVTGHADEGEGKQAVQLGAQDYLIKEQVTPDSLQRAIEFAAARFELEQKLRASEERARHLAAAMTMAADASGVGFWSWNVGNGAIDSDENNRRMLGLPPTGPVGFDDFLQRIFEDDRPRLEAAIEGCLRNGTNYDEQFRVRHPDRSMHWIAARGSVIRDAHGATIGMTGVAFDISERKKIEQALIENRERLGIALNAAQMSTWEWDLTANKIEWSENLEPQLGLKPGSFAGAFEAFVELVHPDDRERVGKAVKAAVEDGADYEIEFRMVRADGGIRWTETRGRVTRDEKGKAIRMMGIDLDITARKEQEEELQHSGRRFRRLIESNIVAIACANLQGVTEANDAFLRLVGATREDLTKGNVDWVKMTPPEHLHKDLNGLEELKKKGHCGPFEKEFIRSDGSRVPILIGGTALSTSPLEWLCFILDLSELKRVEGELRKSQEQLENKVAERTRELVLSLARVELEVMVRTQAEEQLRELSSRLLQLQDEERRGIARELHDSTGQTLSALKLSLATLGKVIGESVPRAAALLDDLNALTDQALQEIRTTSHLLHPPLLDEVGFISAARWYVEGFTQRSGIQTTVDFSAAPRMSKAADLALFRILQESLTNILRHSKSSTAEIQVYADGENCVLAIRDHGVGIPPEKLRKFNQTGAGVGVGLSGMKQRIRDLGGQLRVECDSQGTAVLATLPLSKLAVETDTDASKGMLSRGTSAG